MTVPEEAVTAAAEAMNEELGYEYPPGDRRLEELVETALEAAAPILRDGERERILAAAEALKTSLWRPGNGPAYSETVDVVLWDKLDELLREQP